MKQEFTSGEKPQLTGVAELGVSLIKKPTMASTIQAKDTYKYIKLPATSLLWAVEHNDACDPRIQIPVRDLAW